MKNLRRWMTALACAMVLAVACGKVGGGGDSETNWLKPCSSDDDCSGSASCACGVCTKPCSEETDCALLGSPARCAFSETASCGPTEAARLCLPLGQSGSDLAGAPNFAGSGGTGGAECIPAPANVGGSISISPAVPPPGSACRSEHEGLEICTLSNGMAVLSRCTNQSWETMDDASPCTSPIQECNAAVPQSGVCCDVPRYCTELRRSLRPGYCDGKVWTLLPASSGMAGGDTGGVGGTGGAACTPQPPGAAGAISIRGIVPPPESVCRAEDEGLEICTGFSIMPVLSRCTNQRWVTVGEGVGCSGRTHECNMPGVETGVCCDVPRYCERLTADAVPGYCNGTAWQLFPGAVAGGPGAGGTGGASCTWAAMPAGGAFGLGAVPPALGAPCAAADESLELCTFRSGNGGPTVLSRCTNQRWETIEDPSSCVANYRDCNRPEARTGVCCDEPRYCARLPVTEVAGYCNGVFWSLQD